MSRGRWPDLTPGEEGAYWEEIRLGQREADGRPLLDWDDIDRWADEPALVLEPELARAIGEADAGRGR